jgi:hypothetical protein
MIFIFLLVGLLASTGLMSSGSATLLLFVCQLTLLVVMIRKGNASATGAFLFMSFLFFGIRPLYILIEGDFHLLQSLFQISPDLEECNWAMWWATLGSIAFFAGSKASKDFHIQYFKTRARRLRQKIVLPLVSNSFLLFLVVYQILSLGVMALLAGKNLYGSTFGAYLYDLPVFLQSGHIFTLILFFERYLKSKSLGILMGFGISGVLFLVLTWQMREMTMFRGFYITGIMVAGIAGVARLKQRVNYLWLILPIVLLLPTFRTLGENRYATNDEISQKVTSQGEPFVARYWNFFDGDGDMNIFDSFVAAKKATPSQHPYILTWLYVPVHFVPRAFWTSKPENGTLVDHAFSNGAPYSPGIAGYFVLDGGLIWMVLCMAFLGYLMGGIDLFIFSMAPGYLRCCLQGILVVNALYLTRFFLWQSFYQVLYAVIPCIALDYLIKKRKKTKMSRPRCSQVLLREERTTTPETLIQ